MPVKSLLRKLKNKIAPSAPPAPLPTPTESPWFDRPDAIAHLEGRRRRREIDDFEFDRLRKWVTDGYFVVDGLISAAALDAMNGDIDALWTAEVPRPGVSIHNLKLEEGVPAGDVPHETIVTLPPQKRLELRDGGQNWRIHTFYQHSEPTRRIALDRKISRWLSLIFERPSQATNSINFLYGSRQNLHQDMAVFPIQPLNYLVGVWIAAEDITPERGPLVYYPGSHREPMWEGFAGYPEVYMRTCSREDMGRYNAHVDEVARNYEKHTFLAKKGDVLFWHGMIIHGGEKDTEPGKTRKSLVLHSIPPGCDITGRLSGPFNW